MLQAGISKEVIRQGLRDYAINTSLYWARKLLAAVTQAAVDVIEECEQVTMPAGVQIIVATSPLLTQPQVRHLFNIFTVKLQEILRAQYDGDEIFVMQNRVVVLSPRRECGHEIAGNNVHIMPHEVPSCLADIEFLLQLFYKKQRRMDPEHQGWATLPWRILKCANAAVTFTMLCRYAAKKIWGEGTHLQSLCSNTAVKASSVQRTVKPGA